MTQKEYLALLLKEAEDIAKLASAKYSSFTNQQLNWKPGPNIWSIGEVFDHVITTNDKYYLLFEDKLISYVGESGSSLPIKHTLIGRMLIQSVKPGSRKVKTYKVFKPSSTNYTADIYKKFFDQHNELIDFIKQSNKVDINKVKVISPVNMILRYSLGDALAVLVYHTRRHLNQIESVNRLLPVEI